MLDLNRRCLLLLSLLIPAAFLLASCGIFFDAAVLNKQAADAVKRRDYVTAESYILRLIGILDNKLNQSVDMKPSSSRKLAKELAGAYSNLAKIRFEQGQYGNAIHIYENAIVVYEKYCGRKNEFIARCLHAISTCYFLQGKLLEAEKSSLEELAIQQSIFKPDQLHIAATANNLAQIYQKLGDNEQAEKYFRWALGLCEGNKKNSSGEMVDILSNLATFLQKEGRYVEALSIAKRALKLQSSPKQKYSSDRVRTLFVLAGICKAGLDFDAAEEYYLDALKLLESKIGANPALLCDGLEQYATLLMAERRYKEAEPVFERCLKSCESLYGSEHPYTAEKSSNFAVLYRRTGQLDKAEALLRKTLLIQEKSLGVDTPIFLETLNRLTAVLDDAGKYKDADMIYREVMPKLKSSLGLEHPYVADAMDNWSLFVEKVEGKDAADKVRTDATRIRLKLARSLHPQFGPKQE